MSSNSPCSHNSLTKLSCWPKTVDLQAVHLYSLHTSLCAVFSHSVLSDSFLKSCLFATHIIRDFTGFPVLSPQIKTISFKDVTQFWRLTYKTMLGYSPIQHDVWLEFQCNHKVDPCPFYLPFSPLSVLFQGWSPESIRSKLYSDN